MQSLNNVIRLFDCQLYISSQITSLSLSNTNSATAKPEDSTPGFFCCIVNQDGETTFSHTSGKRGIGTSKPMTMDNVF